MILHYIDAYDEHIIDEFYYEPNYNDLLEALAECCLKHYFGKLVLSDKEIKTFIKGCKDMIQDFTFEQQDEWEKFFTEDLLEYFRDEAHE